VMPSNLDDFKKNLIRKSSLARKTFSTEEGKELLEILKNEFMPENLIGDDVNNTYFNLGRRDVIIYIEQLMRVDYE
jgi:hypothetical protein